VVKTECWGVKEKLGGAARIKDSGKWKREREGGGGDRETSSKQTWEKSRQKQGGYVGTTNCQAPVKQENPHGNTKNSDISKNGVLLAAMGSRVKGTKEGKPNLGKKCFNVNRIGRGKNPKGGQKKEQRGWAKHDE